MEWIEVASEKLGCPSVGVDDFWSAVEVWVRRPHVINRRVMGAVVLWEGPEGEGAWLKELELKLKHTYGPGEHQTVGTDGDKSTSAAESCDDLVTEGAVAVDHSNVDDHVTDHVTHVDGHMIQKRQWILRELIPRMQRIPKGREVVIIGNSSEPDTACTTSLDSESVFSFLQIRSGKLPFSTPCLRMEPEHRYMTFVPNQMSIPPHTSSSTTSQKEKTLL